MNYQEFIQEFNRRKEEELRKREEYVAVMKSEIYQKLYDNLDLYLTRGLERALNNLSLELIKGLDYHILNIDEGLLSLEEHRTVFEDVIQSLSDKWAFQLGYNVDFEIGEEYSNQSVHIGHNIQITLDLSSPRDDSMSKEELFVLLAALMTFS